MPSTLGSWHNSRNKYPIFAWQLSRYRLFTNYFTTLFIALFSEISAERIRITRHTDEPDELHFHQAHFTLKILDVLTDRATKYRFIEMKYKATLLLVILMLTVILSSCIVAFPKIERIAALSAEEATKALKGITETEIRENWGEPDGMLSGFYGDIYECNGKSIVIYYDADSTVTDVLISEVPN